MGDQFPAGLRVLVVDDDRTCLAILKRMLLRCAYNVTTCGMARLALAMLRENKERFDVVLSDVYMPDMDGFKLLELVGLEMDLPVIMMSADGETSLVMKGITHGACDYLLKPIRIKELKNIWQHVIRRKRNMLRDVDTSGDQQQQQQINSKRKPEEVELLQPSSGPSIKKRKEAKEDEDDPELELDEASALKKPRVVWSIELHQQFVAAVNQLGIDKAVPKRILELMNVHGLTRENVASHLQKYRLYLKRLSIAQQQQHQQQHQNPVMAIGGSEPSFGPVVEHPIITPGSSQALAALRSAYLRTLSEPPMSGVEQSPVFVVRPRPSAPPNNPRSLLIGVDDLPQSQIVIRSQDGGLLSPPGVGVGVGVGASSSSLVVQQQQQHSQIQPQQYGGFEVLKDPAHPSELGSREDALISGRSFSSGLGGIPVLIAGSGGAAVGGGGAKGMIKCEEADAMNRWDGGGASSSYGISSSSSWQDQQQQPAGAMQLHHEGTIVPYSGAGAPDPLLQRHEYLGTAICSLGNPNPPFKVKQENHQLHHHHHHNHHHQQQHQQQYDPVAVAAPGHFAAGDQQLPAGGGVVAYKQGGFVQEQETGFFDHELGLEGYVIPGNLYVK